LHKISIANLEVTTHSKFEDRRGSFERLFDSVWTKELDLLPQQVNISRNKSKGTLRGLHFQIAGQPEHKLITLLSGSVYLAVIDLRKDSKSYLQVNSFEVNSDELKSIFIPFGCATGWVSLEPNTDILYVMYSRFEENSYSGLRYDDSFFKIPWPIAPSIISEKDMSWPLFDPRE
jgi:dTDP-4-dehydrorhamnose 3,5-epimerase